MFDRPQRCYDPGTAIMAMQTATQAVNSIASGYAAKSEAKYNATVLREKGKLIDVQSDIENAQYERAKSTALGKSIVSVAGMGIAPQGSALAVMLDTQTQMGIDQAISRFNYNQQKNTALAEANTEIRRGRAAVRSSYVVALTQAGKGASDYAMTKRTDEGTKKDNVFETTKTKRGNTTYYNKTVR